MSLYEMTGTVLGLAGVWLMIRQNVWGWPVGIVQVAVYAWVFFEAKLYSDALLQICFFGIQAYGWWHWLRGSPRSPDEGGCRGVQPERGRKESGSRERAPQHAEMLPVTRLRWRGVGGWTVVGLIATGAWGELMRRNTDAALPHWDAFILVFSLIAQWWQARKRLECWAGWMVVNVVAIGVYWSKDLQLTAGLYVMFFAMAVAGHVAWRRSVEAAANRLGDR